MALGTPLRPPQRPRERETEEGEKNKRRKGKARLSQRRSRIGAELDSAAKDPGRFGDIGKK